MRSLTILTSVLLLTGCVSSHVSTPKQEQGVSQRDALVLVDIDGKQHNVQASLEAGKPVALVFWQTWCASCLREAPGIARAARELGSGMQFFGVVPGSDEFVDEAKVRSVANKLQLPYPQCRDSDAELTHRFHVKGTPTIVILGKGGEVVYEGHHPPQDWSMFLTR